jgi:hypothetical protein
MQKVVEQSGSVQILSLKDPTFCTFCTSCMLLHYRNGVVQLRNNLRSESIRNASHSFERGERQERGSDLL